MPPYEECDEVPVLNGTTFLPLRGNSLYVDSQDEAVRLKLYFCRSHLLRRQCPCERRLQRLCPEATAVSTARAAATVRGNLDTQQVYREPLFCWSLSLLPTLYSNYRSSQTSPSALIITFHSHTQMLTQDIDIMSLLPHRKCSEVMQARMQEMLARHSQMFGIDDATTAPTAPTACLLGLPAELRNRIYELALWHDVTDGIIAPLSDVWRPPSQMAFVSNVSGGRTTRRALDLVSSLLGLSLTNVDESQGPLSEVGERILVDRGCRPFRTSEFDALELEGSQPTGPPPRRRTAQLMRDDEREHKWYTSKFYTHRCRLECLLQPALTIVNAQLRREALPIFYAVNHFHFEMHNFTIQLNARTKRKSGIRYPLNWWRAIGDSNLRALRSISIVGHPVKTFANTGGLLLFYRPRDNAVEIESLPSRSRIWIQTEDDTSAQKMSDAEAALAPFVAVLEESGPHVRVLEGILGAMEEKQGEYLLDRTALA